jgi:hypothetical protein
MKTDKPKVQKKVAKKAAKKEIAKSLTDRFMEHMTELGHEAEKIGVDIKKVGLSVVKKLTGKFSNDKSGKNGTVAKKDKKIQKVVKKAVVKARPVAQSVKVIPIVTEEKVADAITKKPVVEKPVHTKPKKTVVKTPKDKNAANNNSTNHVETAKTEEDKLAPDTDATK